MSEADIISLERDAVASTGIKPKGRCRLMALLACFGLHGTPRARIIRELLRSWFQILRGLSQQESLDTRVAWAKAKQHILNDNVSIKNVRGIMSNVIYTLLKAKWDPSTFNCWKSPEGTIWAIVDFKVSPDVVAGAVTKSYFDNQLVSASQHFDGLGMGDGIDVDATLRLTRLQKYDYSVSYKYKAALETIIAGACWPMARVHGIVESASPTCPRCQNAEETSLHTFWTCPCNALIEDEHVQRTQYMIERARTGCINEPCLWLRGILPDKYAEIPDVCKPTNDLLIKRINEENCFGESGIYSGTGGKHTKHRAPRRCGVGLVCYRNGVFHYGIHSNLPGAVQTVYRGELFALVLLTCFLVPHAIAEFVTDNENVARMFSKGENAAKNSCNCDVFKKISNHIHDKRLTITVRWMPSHISDGRKKRPDNVSDLDIEANDKADELAAEAAQLAELSDATASNYLGDIVLVSNIQKRLASILLGFPKGK